MKYKIKVSLFVIISLLYALLSQENKINKNDIVILLSFDGIRWDSIYDIKGFSIINDSGFRAKKLRSVFPSMTLPAHASLTTGTYPEKHGIVLNHFLEKNSGLLFKKENNVRWLKREPIWAILEKKGLQTALIRWPLSKGSYEGIIPSFYYETQTDQETLNTLFKTLQSPKVPNLIMAYFSGADYAGHHYGPNSCEYKNSVIRSGEILEKVVARIKELKIKDNLTIFVASDHGMTEVLREIDIVSKIPKKGFYPYISISGPIAFVYTQKESQYSDVRKALRKFKSLFYLYESFDIPAEFNVRCSDRIGDFIIVCQKGDIFKPLSGRGEKLRGAHGYPPDNPDMCGIFLAWGKNVPKKSVEEVKIVDIVPTIMKIFNIKDCYNMDGKEIF